MSSYNGKSAATRLRQDYLRLKRDPVPYINAEPLPSNILEWHYVVKGPKSTPFDGGYYHGKLVFPKEFPFKPPSIYMITPSGRFRTNTRLCLSISDFHPETWNPAWSVSTILIGLLSFLNDRQFTLGSIDSTIDDKRQFAYKSLEFNLRDTLFCELFPDIATEMQDEIDQRAAINASTETQNPNQRTKKSCSLHLFLRNLVLFLGFIFLIYSKIYSKM